MKRIFQLIVIIILLAFIAVNTGQLSAQDDYVGDDGYAIALQRIQEAVDNDTVILDLSGLNLSELPPELWQLINLQSLELAYNQLTELPAEIGQLSNLQSLIVSNNQLTILPAEIGQLTNLQSLWLNDNQLTELPSEIGQLSNLQSLIVSNNQLTILPAEIGQLTNLESLILNNNQLSTLPPEFRQLSNLQWLGLENNNLTALPTFVGNLLLAALYIEGNPLEFPPPEIVDQGHDAIMDFLRHPPPYPPYTVNEIVVGTVVAWLLMTIASVWGLLHLLNRGGIN